MDISWLMIAYTTQLLGKIYQHSYNAKHISM